jgi:serine/threonine protein kinase
MNNSGWIGKTLGDRYEIQELLGEGGMSAVYKAYDPNLRRVVAVKLIHSHLSRDPQFVRRFEEEAAAVAKLRHENIIQVYDFNNDGSTYYIVFEFVPGESLRERMVRLNESDRIMPQDDVISYSSSVADALHYAHKRGIIHRDIKPANVMISVHGQAILTDFGIAKIVGGDTHTATGAVLGTARYISPEQVRSEAVDYRTDIYSLGVTIFEMASGEPPFAADSAMTVMMMHINDPVPDIRTLRPDLPARLAQVINQAMAKKADQRYQDASELAAALRSVDKDQLGAAAAAAHVVAQPPPSTVAAPPPVRKRPAAHQSTSPQPYPPRMTAAPSPPTILPAAAGESKGGNRSIVLIGAAGAIILLILCIAAAAVIFGTGILSGQEEETPIAQVGPTLGNESEATAAVDELNQTETPTKAAVVEPTEEPTKEPTEELEIEPTLAPTIAPSATPPPVPTAEPSPTLTATDTPPPTDSPTAAPTEPAGLSVLINSIGLDVDSYVVDYTPQGYTPQLPGTHIHFFFNTVPPQNAGVGPTQEPWILYGGPNPFTGYKVGDRPSGATQMCTLVANPDHTIQLGTGNCANLP